jgi:hypothetical protein
MGRPAIIARKNRRDRHLAQTQTKLSPASGVGSTCWIPSTLGTRLIKFTIQEATRQTEAR